MRRLTARRLTTVAAACGILALASCAAAPSVDLDAARAWVEGVQADESDGPGSAGSAALLVDPAAHGSDEPSSSRVELDFAAEATLTRAEARCFGGGTVEVTVTASPGTAHTDEIACDEEPHDIDLGGETASAAVIEAHGDTATYAYVLLIQELTIGSD